LIDIEFDLHILFCANYHCTVIILQPRNGEQNINSQGLRNSFTDWFDLLKVKNAKNESETSRNSNCAFAFAFSKCHHKPNFFLQKSVLRRKKQFYFELDLHLWRERTYLR
jgi:hypothetical protein